VTITPVENVTVHGLVVMGNPGATTSSVVADITDTDSSGVPSDYGVTIDWGDGTSSQGQVAGGSGFFEVAGSHMYALAPAGQGTFKTTITVTRSGNTFIGYGLAESYPKSFPITKKDSNGAVPTIGLLTFQTSPGNIHACTATVIASPNQSVILAAAHCVYGNWFGETTTDHFFSDFQFAPGHWGGLCYDVAVTDPRCSGTQNSPKHNPIYNPYGVWQDRGIEIVDPQYQPRSDANSFDNHDHSFDYAFIVLNGSPLVPGPAGNVPVQQAVGGVPIAFNASNTSKETLIGYAGADVQATNCGTGLKGGCVQTPVSCASMTASVGTDDLIGSLPVGHLTNCSFGAGIFPKGASGSPWMNANNTVPGVEFDFVASRTANGNPGPGVQTDVWGPYLGETAGNTENESATNFINAALQ
jgi:hypothetical protein